MAAAAIAAGVFSLGVPAARDGETASATQEPAIAVRDLRGGGERQCPAVVTSMPFVRGGCRASGYQFNSKLSIRTAFGTMPFGSCIVTFDMTLASDGRMWLDRVNVGGATPCNDVWACSPADAPGWADDVHFDPPRASRFPWAGRLRARDGSTVRGSVDACVDTCVGRFAGPLELELRRKDDAWVMRTQRAGFGSSGLAIDGEWPLKPGRFAIR